MDAAKLPDYDEIRRLVGEIKLGFDFTHARSLLESVRPIYCEAGKRDPEEKQRYVWATQQLALCTYKDENLHPITRFDISLRPVVHPRGLAQRRRWGGCAKITADAV